jgi:hypothetical protein
MDYYITHINTCIFNSIKLNMSTTRLHALYSMFFVDTQFTHCLVGIQNVDTQHYIQNLPSEGPCCHYCCDIQRMFCLWLYEVYLEVHVSSMQCIQNHFVQMNLIGQLHLDSIIQALQLC